MVQSSRRFGSYSLFGWLALALIGSYFVFPLNRHLRLGIDLVGGYYLTLQVQTDEAVKAELLERMYSAINRLKEQQVEAVSFKVIGQEYQLTFKTLDEVQKAAGFLKSHAADMTIHTDGMVLTARLTEMHVAKIKEWAVESNIDVLRKRLDATGTAEIAIVRQGEQNIVVELPNIDDPARAKEMIGRVAQLDVKLVHKSARSEEDLLDDHDGILPDGMMIVADAPNANRQDREMNYYLVDDYTDLTGRDLKHAEAQLGGVSGTEPVVAFQFRPEGSERFYEVTSKNHGRQLAIVLDNQVICAPVIRATLPGSGVISGNFTWDSAQDLATMLKAGSFVAPVKFEEERRIGPSLGQESIRQGLMSCLIGLVALFIFSIVWYKAAGLLAFLALVYNLLLIIFFMAWLKATLTLPGIAGMILTIGMAIDCSILIYERIREVLATGMTYKKAVEEGFSGAMTVILDANITTLLMGVVLYKFGTGPVQGFAVTMILGIFATLATGLFFLKSLFNFVLYNTQKQNISI